MQIKNNLKIKSFCENKQMINYKLTDTGSEKLLFKLFKSLIRIENQ